jgi:HTH-type transcriptional regulator/antitoxin HigA
MSMAVKKSVGPLPDTYLELIRQWPLARIQDDECLDKACALIDRLLTHNLDEGGQRYLDALTDLVETYENHHVLIRDASEADVLAELMHANGLTQAKLAREVGISQSTISDVLNGKRRLTRKQVIALAQRFAVSPTAFLPA